MKTWISIKEKLRQVIGGLECWDWEAQDAESSKGKWKITKPCEFQDKIWGLERNPTIRTKLRETHFDSNIYRRKKNREGVSGLGYWYWEGRYWWKDLNLWRKIGSLGKTEQRGEGEKESERDFRYVFARTKCCKAVLGHYLTCQHPILSTCLSPSCSVSNIPSYSCTQKQQIMVHTYFDLCTHMKVTERGGVSGSRLDPNSTLSSAAIWSINKRLKGVTLSLSLYVYCRVE